MAGGDPLKAEEGSQTGGSLRAGASASPKKAPGPQAEGRMAASSSFKCSSVVAIIITITIE